MNSLTKLDSWYSWQRSGLATKKTTEAQVQDQQQEKSYVTKH